MVLRKCLLVILVMLFLLAQSIGRNLFSRFKDLEEGNHQLCDMPAHLVAGTSKKIVFWSITCFPRWVTQNLS
jgi:hypothetical protein